MKKDKQQSSFVNIGSSSLLIVFLVLCLASFAILSLSSAKSDHSFSEELADHKTEYYNATSKASLVLDKIDNLLADSAESFGSFGNSYKNEVTALLHEAQIDDITLTCRTINNNLIVCYQIPVRERQALDVKLSITDYTESETYYEIDTWQIISTDTWESDQKLNLMQLKNKI